MKKKAPVNTIKRTLCAMLLTGASAAVLCIPVSVLVSRSIVSIEAAERLLIFVWAVASFLGAMTIKSGGIKAVLPFCAVLITVRLIVSLIAGNTLGTELLLSESAVICGAMASVIRIKKKRRKRAK